MTRRKAKLKRITIFSLMVVGFASLLIGANPREVEAVNFGGPTHIGTFEGSTTFTTSSSNGINPGLFIEVIDRYGNLKQYESEEGVITVPDTKEGAYITQAKLLGKTKYRDMDTNEILDEWEEGRNLELVSVENPELVSTGKNLLDTRRLVTVNDGVSWNTLINDNVVTSRRLGNVNNGEFGAKIKINVKPSTTYTLFAEQYKDGVEFGGAIYVYQDCDLWGINSNVFYGNSRFTFTTPSNAEYITIGFNYGKDMEVGTVLETKNIQLEESSTVMSYEPYQSNILTVNEEVELHGIDEVRDELDLLTGEVTQRIGVEIFDRENATGFYITDAYQREGCITFMRNQGFDWATSPKLICDKLLALPVGNWFEDVDECCFAGTVFVVRLKSIKASNVLELRDYLSQNPITVQYELATESVKTVALTSTYQFRPVNTRDVYVEGDVEPLVCSVTMPTEALSFVLNPNQEEGKQFVAPEFSITNETSATIQVILKTFEQEGDVFNDVLPTEHEDWSLLDQEQSKDIALALVPQMSDGWVELNEGAYYVANHESSVLGRVKGRSTVDFTFEASHGQAFIEKLNPRYKLVFVFDF